jgi:hypothetical protein
MTEDNSNVAANPTFPRVRLVFVLFLAMMWVVSMPFSLVWIVPDSTYGPVGDGSDMGYERVRAFGLAYGCVVMQTIHRIDNLGFRCKQTDVHFHLLLLRDHVEGHWTETSSGVSLLAIAMGIGATTIPYWRKGVMAGRRCGR